MLKCIVKSLAQKSVFALSARTYHNDNDALHVRSAFRAAEHVYKLKLRRDGTIDKFKARYVCCGYSQVEGVDFDHTFSATMKATSFRTLLALCVANGLSIDHMDVSNAFTQADIDKDIWVECAKGYGHRCGNVLRLKKALYGTKQAAAAWQKALFKYDA